jgi:hypothetical protein
VTVSMMIGPQAQAYPWFSGDTPPSDNTPRIVLCRHTKTAGRMRPRAAFQQGFVWKVVHTTTTMIALSYRVVLWHSRDEPIDLGRAMKTALYVEKNFQMCTSQKIEDEWRKHFREAWETKPWA